jgi:hypothetical protein
LGGLVVYTMYKKLIITFHIALIMLSSAPSYGMDSMQGYMPSFKIIGAMCGAVVVGGIVGYIFGYNRCVDQSNRVTEESRKKMALEFEGTKMCSVNLLFSLYDSKNSTDLHTILADGFTQSDLNSSLTRARTSIQTLLESPENKEVSSFRELMMQQARK